ncbi:DUF3693 domain-containing protein [Vibrio scophthalmi]|uniref:DUF3693 domain-containing protein n=1 Tax=Vibrio scophthalmi TaxID=45658 RepID=UPI003B8A6268
MQVVYGLGLSIISMTCGALALVLYTPKEALSQCALWRLTLNNILFCISLSIAISFLKLSVASKGQT